MLKLKLSLAAVLALSVPDDADQQQFWNEWNARYRGAEQVSHLDPATIIALVRDEVERLAAPSARNLLSALRSFLRFLYVTGRTSQPLVAAVPAAAVTTTTLPSSSPCPFMIGAGPGRGWR